MPAARHLVLIAYDIPDDRARGRVSDWLEERLTRVQGSLFEGWETSAAAERIAARAAILAGEGASVRLYVIPRGGVARCQAWGFPPAPAPDGALIV